MWFNPYADKQLVHPVAHCTVCQGEIYPNDRCELDGCYILCEQCANDRSDNAMYRTQMSGEELDAYINNLCGGNHEE